MTWVSPIDKSPPPILSNYEEVRAIFFDYRKSEKAYMALQTSSAHHLLSIKKGEKNR